MPSAAGLYRRTFELGVGTFDIDDPDDSLAIHVRKIWYTATGNASIHLQFENHTDVEDRVAPANLQARVPMPFAFNPGEADGELGEKLQAVVGAGGGIVVLVFIIYEVFPR